MQDFWGLVVFLDSSALKRPLAQSKSFPHLQNHKVREESDVYENLRKFKWLKIL